jgi:C-terminal processing protease CtpA/Prc
MGLVIQRIEPNARIALDGRVRPGDRLIEINQTSLIGADFVKAQEILREAIRHSNQTANGRLDFKLVRSRDTQALSNERGIETEPSNYAYHDDRELQYEISRQNSIDPENKENTLEHFNTSQNTQSKDNSSFHNNNPSSVNMSALNTKKPGRRIVVELTKGPQGLGFKLSARDNCSHHEFSPIYIKNILPKGAAIADARLQRGDRLLEVNGQDMTQMSLTDAVNILRNTKLGSCVEIIVSRQVMPGGGETSLTETNSGNLPREISPERGLNPVETAKSEQDTCSSASRTRQLLTFEIALNDTGSAGLGVSVKGKTKRIEDNDCSIDLGIFIKTVINGGAASKDGQLKANDQLININGFSLLGKSNEEAMLILREAMQVESRPGHIQLTVSRKTRGQETVRTSQQQQAASESPATRQQVVKVIQHGSPAAPRVHEQQQQQQHHETTAKPSSRFARDAPSRRSMSEKRTKIGQSHTALTISRLNSNTINNSRSTTDSDSTQPKRSKTSDPISGDDAALYTSRTLHKNFRTANNGNAKPALTNPANLNQDSTSSIATSSSKFSLSLSLFPF